MNVQPILQTSIDGSYISRHVGIRIGAPVSTPAVTVNRMCGSGFQSIISACNVSVYVYIKLGLLILIT